jgi:hypothetical protein
MLLTENPTLILFNRKLIIPVNRRLDVRAAYRFLDVQTKYKSGLIEKPLLSKHRGFLNIAYSTRKIKKTQWKIDLTYAVDRKPTNSLYWR